MKPEVGLNRVVISQCIYLIIVLSECERKLRGFLSHFFVGTIDRTIYYWTIYDVLFRMYDVNSKSSNSKLIHSFIAL